jgi:hypothetical protein
MRYVGEERRRPAVQLGRERLTYKIAITLEKLSLKLPFDRKYSSFR